MLYYELASALNKQQRKEMSEILRIIDKRPSRKKNTVEKYEGSYGNYILFVGRSGRVKKVKIYLREDLQNRRLK